MHRCIPYLSNISLKGLKFRYAIQNTRLRYLKPGSKSKKFAAKFNIFILIALNKYILIETGFKSPKPALKSRKPAYNY